MEESDDRFFAALEQAQAMEIEERQARRGEGNEGRVGSKVIDIHRALADNYSWKSITRALWMAQITTHELAPPTVKQYYINRVKTLREAGEWPYAPLRPGRKSRRAGLPTVELAFTDLPQAGSLMPRSFPCTAKAPTSAPSPGARAKPEALSKSHLLLESAAQALASASVRPKPKEMGLSQTNPNEFVDDDI